MRKLLNTLYVSPDNRYLSLDGENVVVSAEGSELGRMPLHILESIITFGYAGASPALMRACSERNISITFMSPYGNFWGRVSGKSNGNVLLRRQQYRLADDAVKSNEIAKNFILAKLHNAKWVLERMTRDYPLRIEVEQFKEKSGFISEQIKTAIDAQSNEELRGIEGVSASIYFSLFDDMILQQKDDFFFHGRSKRPPKDNVNAMLSFTYSLLASMCASALEAVGLDSYVGFMHTDRPGRASLALDLMEELRSVFADRFVLSLINKRMMKPKDFLMQESGSVLMTDEARKEFLSHWQTRKKEKIVHPFTNEKIEWGLVPLMQAMLLARYIRGDVDEYPPFLWK